MPQSPRRDSRQPRQRAPRNMNSSTRGAPMATPRMRKSGTWVDWLILTMESSGPSTPIYGATRPKRKVQARVAAPQTGQCHHLVRVLPRYSQPDQPGRTLPMNQQAGQTKKMVEKAMRPATSPSVERAIMLSRFSGSPMEVKRPSLKAAIMIPMIPMICEAMKRRTAQRRVHQPFQGDFSAEGGGGGVAPAVT